MEKEITLSKAFINFTKQEFKKIESAIKEDKTKDIQKRNEIYRNMSKHLQRRSRNIL